MKRFRYSLACCTALVGVTASWVAAAADANKGGVETIVVTAERRSEQIVNVPMSVSAVTPEIIAKTGITGMEDLNRVAVGVQLNFGGSFFQPSIRGVSTLTNGAQAENNVGVYVDGFYDPGSVTINADFANVESVQVLKGPQGTLYGRNATGGAILITTLGPKKEFTGKFDASYGKYDDKRFTGYLAGPINDRIRFSLSGYYRESPGYEGLASPTVIGATVGQTGKVEKETFDAKLEADITDDLVATLGYNWGYIEDDRVARFDITAYPASFLPPPPARSAVFGDVAYDYPSYLFSIRNRGSLKLAWNTGIGTLTSTTGYTGGRDKQQSDFDGTYYSIFYFGSNYKNEIFQQSLDYDITSINKLDLLAGALFYKAKIFTVPFLGTPFGIFQGAGGVNTSYNKFNQDTKSWAGYLDATYHVTDDISATVGGRFSHDTKSATYEGHVALPGGIAGPFNAGPYANSTTWNKFTPRANVRYEFSPASNVYASFTQGFRNGNFNGSGPPPGFAFAPNKPETVDAFEVGYKTVQGPLSFDTAAFYYIYKNIQVNIVVPEPVSGTPSNVFSNGPGAKIYGLDADTDYKPFDDLDLHAGLEWLHARYDHFPNADGTGLDGATMTNIADVTQDWSGKQLARAPNFTANFSFDYTMHIVNDSTLDFAANVNYTTSYALNNVSTYDAIVNGVNLAPLALQGKQRYRQSAMALVNAQLTWTAPDGKYYVQAWGKNLSNHTYRLNYNGSAFGDYGPKAEPITFGGKVGIKF